jgi:hypothetical protein
VNELLQHLFVKTGVKLAEKSPILREKIRECSSEIYRRGTGPFDEITGKSLRRSTRWI